MSKQPSLIKQVTEWLAEDKRRHEAELARLKSEINTYKVKVRKLTRQKNEAVGRAREYRGYATKYQKELAALRNSLRNTDAAKI